MAIGQWKKATERGGKEGRNCRLCGRGGTAALKSASLVVRQSGGGEFSFRSRWRPAIDRHDAEQAASKRALDSTSIARQLPPPPPLFSCPVRFILLLSRCLSLFPRVDHRGPRNLEHNSSNAASSSSRGTSPTPCRLVVRAWLAPLAAAAAKGAFGFDVVNIWLRPH